MSRIGSLCVAAGLLLGFTLPALDRANAEEAIAPPVYLHWPYRCDGSLQTRPAFHQGTLYLACMDGSVHAVDAATGEGKWSREVGGMILADPVVDAGGEQLLVGCDDGHVYALALGNGQQRWSHRTSGDWNALTGPQVKGQPILDGERIYVTNLLGGVAALQAADGKPLWQVSGYGLAGGSARKAGNRLLFTTTQRGLVCLDTTSGKLLWELKSGRSFSTPTIAADVAYVGISTGPSFAGKGAVFAVDLGAGKEIWRRQLEGQGHFPGQVVGAPLVVGETVIVADIEGRITGLSRADGEPRWMHQSAAGFWSGPQRFGHHAWLASTDGQLIAVDLQHPEESPWKLSLKTPLWAAPIAHAGRLYQATDDGYLLCLAAEKPDRPVERPPVQAELRFKHPAPQRKELLHEFVGTAAGFKSQPFGGPPRESDLRGKQRHFTFQLKVERGGAGPDGKTVPPGRTMQVVSRPLTNYFDWNCSPTFTSLPVDWTKQPRLRVVGSYEPPVLNPYADGKTQPRPMCAYLIQQEPEAGTLVPAPHWPAWYVNNWVHFTCDMYEVGHDRVFANTGHINWGWDLVEERTMGQYLPRDVWAQVRPRYYLWRAVNGLRQIRDPRSGILRGVPTTLTVYLSGARHADPYFSERDLRAARPKPVIRADRVSGKAPLTVKFRGQASGGRPILWYAWTFDSSQGLKPDAVESTASHTYDEPGKYMVSLTAVTEAGTVGHAHQVIDVLP